MLQRGILSGLRRGLSSSQAAAFSTSGVSQSLFSDVQVAPKDPILGITEAFLADQNSEKMNLGVGAYRDDDCKPVVLNVVREAESRIAGSNFMEYLPIGGMKAFSDLSVKLAFGEDALPIQEGRVAAVQSLSGTGSCRLMAEFMHRYLPQAKIWIPKPTWSNHHNIWKDAQVQQELYRYYKPESRGLDQEGLLEDLSKGSPGDVVLLHACAHNPTGVDPTPQQWKEISKLMKEKQLFPFFDMAYQGFASGDCTRDAQAIRVFLEDGHLMGCSQSYAKNMGLYGQRIGCFSIITDSADEAKAVESQMKAIARPMYSNPPLHGALLVKEILGNEALKQQWYEEVRGMAERIISMRALLRQHLEDLKNPLPWKHVTEQIGMFCFSGISPEQVDRLAQDYSIYMTRNGRISMAGVTTKNVSRLAEALHKVTTD
ncbi:L-asparaginase 1 [Coccomyxa viridis]|uniref:Aspartate aminotransferase n=1 Tax=Coccomyxa viridis TaxID=1274662 RepID=A0AAV1I186_9CHLO|nr:L-asparaginase 1 [Coccomyxa viridis]